MYFSMFLWLLLSKNIQNVRKLLENSYSGQKPWDLPLKSYCWSPNLLGSSFPASHTISTSAWGSDQLLLNIFLIWVPATNCNANPPHKIFTKVVFKYSGFSMPDKHWIPPPPANSIALTHTCLKLDLNHPHPSIFMFLVKVSRS